MFVYYVWKRTVPKRYQKAFQRGLRFWDGSAVPEDVRECCIVEASTPRPRAATLLERSRNLRLSDAFSVQAGTLYHRIGNVAILNFFDSASGNFEKSASSKGNSLDFPVMINYRFGHLIRPYVGRRRAAM